MAKTKNDVNQKELFQENNIPDLRLQVILEDVSSQAVNDTNKLNRPKFPNEESWGEPIQYFYIIEMLSKLDDKARISHGETNV